MKLNVTSCVHVCREGDEEEVSGSDASAELGADEIEASDDSDVIDAEAPSRKRKAPQTALKVPILPTGLPECAVLSSSAARLLCRAETSSLC